MKGKHKTQEQLVTGLAELRERVAELEASEIERERAEEALRQSEEAHRLLFEQSVDGIVIIANGRIVRANHAFCALHGLPVEKTVGVNLLDLIHPDDRSTCSHRIEALQSGKPAAESQVYRDLRADGSIFWVEVRSKRIEWEEEPALQSIVRDITERVRSEEERAQADEALQESERRFRSIAETASDAIIIFDSYENVFYWNRAAQAIFGYQAGETQGKLLASLIPGRFHEAFRREMERVISQQESDSSGKAIEIVGVRKGGSEFPLELSLATWGTQEDTFFTAIVRDITERVRSEEERTQAEEALRDSERRYKALFEHSNDGVFIFDLNGVYIAVNQRGADMLGYEIDELVGKNAERVIVPEEYPDALQKLETLIAGQPLPLYQRTFLTKDGTRVPTEVNVTPVRDAEGRPTHAQSIVRDTTARKQAEEALELRVKQLAALSQASRAVTASLDLDQVLAKVVSLAGEVMPTDYTSVVLVDEAGRLRESADNLPGVPTLAYRIRDEGLTRWIVRSRQAVIVDEIGEDGAMTPVLGAGTPRVANPHIVEAGVRSLAGLPLMAKDTLMGVLYLHSLHPGAFAGQLPLLTAFANQAAIAVENARLFEKGQQELNRREQAQKALRRYAERLRALRAIDGAILAAWSPEEIAQTALRHVRKLVPCRRASVAVFGADADQARVIAIQADGESLVSPGTPLPPEDFGDLDELRQGKHYVVQDITALPHPTTVEQTLLEEGVRSFAVFPLIAHGELVGTLNLGAENPGAFEPEHVDIAREMGDELAVALHQARLLDQIQRHAEELEQQVAERTRDLERRSVQLQVAAEVARDATTARDLDDLLNRAVNLVQERFGFYHASIFLVDERGEYAVLRAAAGAASRKILKQRYRLKVGEVGIVGHVAGNGRPYVAPDVNTDPVYYRSPLLPETRSEMTLPLKVGERVIGVLDAQSSEEAAFDEENAAALRILADQLAVAIERTRLFERTQATLEERLQAVVSNAPIVLVALDREGVFTLAEGKGLDALGIKPGDHVGESASDVYRNQPDVQEYIRRALAGEATAPVVEVSGLLFETWYAPLHDESGEVTGVIGVATDVTERKRAEEAQRASEEYARNVIDSSLDMVITVDMDRRIVEFNKAAQRTFSYDREEVVGKSADVLYVERQDAITVHETTVQEGQCVQEILNRRKSGEAFPSLLSASILRDTRGEVIGVMGVSRDITERKRFEEQMRQQERLAAIGQLAGGIAHDFNNFLTSIMLYAQLLAGKPHLPPDLKPNIEIILDEARGGAQLVQQILDFSRCAMIETGPVDLKPFVGKTVEILRRTLPETIRLVVEIEPEECAAPLVVNADPTRIQQVVMNLAFNARDAMPKGGELRISLSRTEVRPDEQPPIAEMDAGDWVCLAISDTGTGITPNVLPHVFEPFFTTKGPGKGTGLGLAQVHGIVGQHGGCIGVETEVGQGTTFRIYLPAHELEEAEAALRKTPVIPAGKGETILLAEDEEKVREAGREILESLGYRVLTAADGRQALDMYRPGEVDLVITDLVMPKMGGSELARELKKENPHVKVLAITGYALGEDLEELRRARVLGIIQKPLEVSTLAKTIRRILDAQ